MTDRYITAESVNCTTYEVTSEDKKDPDTFNYSNKAKTANGTIQILREYLGLEGTTYIYRGFHDPTKATIFACGDRCIEMWAYKNPSGLPIGSPEPTAFYQCFVTISDVHNADPKRPEHLIPNDVTKIAAASIALQGRYQAPTDNPDNQNYEQYQILCVRVSHRCGNPSPSSRKQLC